MNINFLPIAVPAGVLDRTQLPHEQGGETQSPVLGNFLCQTSIQHARVNVPGMAFPEKVRFGNSCPHLFEQLVDEEGLHVLAGFPQALGFCVFGRQRLGFMYFPGRCLRGGSIAVASDSSFSVIR